MPCVHYIDQIWEVSERKQDPLISDYTLVDIVWHCEYCDETWFIHDHPCVTVNLWGGH